MVVYTCVVGGYDVPIPPKSKDAGVDYICFTDNPNLPSNGWEIVLLQHSSDTLVNETRRSRLPKILPHRYLDRYERSLYIDANLEVTASLGALFAKLDDAPIAFFEHPEGRRDIFAEADVCISMGKDNPDRLKKQTARYRSLGFDGRASTGHQTIPAGMAILRRHNDPAVVSAMETWWSEYLAGSNRDQMCLPYALRNSAVEFDLINENVRKNDWFVWQPHQRTRALKDLSKAYSQASAIILHAPGAEETARRLLADAARTSKRPWHRLLGRLRRRPVLFDTNSLGISPHGAPEMGVTLAEELADKPVALLCDDPDLHARHAISWATKSGAEFERQSDIPTSEIYGVARRRSFENQIRAFLSLHEGPTAIINAKDLENGKLDSLLHWLRAQGRPTWPVLFRSGLRKRWPN